MLELNKIHQGDAMELMLQLENNSIDMAMTSPPYWGLRDYGVEGQIGLEEHPNEYIRKMLRIFHWLKRSLKKTGSFYLNMGDTYFGAISHSDWSGVSRDNFYNIPKFKAKRSGEPDPKLPERLRAREQFKGKKSNWLQPKQLMLMPSRLAIAMQDDGWILRNDIIWHKPNPMPSSVKDRLNTSFEHLFHFVKNKKYYYDLDSIREKHKSSSLQRISQNLGNPKFNGNKVRGHPKGKDTLNPNQFLNPKGKNPGDTMTYEEWYFNQREKKGWHNHENDKEKGFGHQKRGFKVEQMPHPMGKNPGDITESPYQDGVYGHYHQGKDYNLKGKNPADVINRDAAVRHHGSGTGDRSGFKTKREQLLATKMVRNGGPGSTLGEPDEWNQLGKNPGDFMSITTQPFPEAHFAVYPVALCEKPIKSSCPEEGVTLDPFCGAGTTWVALKKYKPNAKFIGFELKKEYIDMAYLRVGKRLDTGPLLNYT